MAPNPLSVWAKEHGLNSTEGQSKLAWALFAEVSRLNERIELLKNSLGDELEEYRTQLEA